MNKATFDKGKIDLREVFETLKNNLWTLIFIVLFTILVTATYLYFSKPIYSSSVIIALDNREQTKLNTEPPLNNRGEERLQLAKVTLQSRKFIKTVIDRVNVGGEFFIRRNFRKKEVEGFSDIKIDIKYREYNGTDLYGDIFEITPIDRQTFKLKIVSENVEGFKYDNIHRYNEEIKNSFFSLRVIKTGETDPFKNSVEYEIMDFVDNEFILDLIKPRYYFRFFDKDTQITTIIKNMQVSDLSENILKIVYQDNLPIQTKEVAEEIAKSYIEYDLRSKTAKLEQTLEFLDKQIIDIKSNLKKSGNELKRYQERSGTAVISVGEDILKSLDKKEELIDKISMQIQEVQKFRNSLQNGVVSTISLISAGIDTNSIQSLIEEYRKSGEEIDTLRFQQNNIDKPVTSNQQINSLINELKNRERYLEELLANFTPEHPQVVEANLELENLKNKINGTIIANIQKLEKSRAIAKSTILNNIDMVENGLKNRLRLLQSSVREKRALLQSIPEKHIINENLKRKFALSDEIYTFLLQKKIEVEISKASIIANTKVLEDAYIPKAPIKPNKRLILLISFIIGFIFGVFHILMREFLDTKIRSGSDIEKLTKIPIYGILPLNINKRFFEEALRAIRTNLQFIMPENKQCINILISSTIAGEGKTTITAGLSKIIAHADKRVLALDLDLRKPRLYQELKQSNKRGISNFLANKNLFLDDVIKPISENLDFLPAGTIPPNPSELLMSRRFYETIKELERHYDYIIFDSAPIGSVIDAHMILKQTDILLLTVKANLAEKEFIENFNRMVEQKKVKSVGIILNGVKVFKNTSYGYGYGYDYGYGQRVE